jgi:hypothetical protein
MSESLNRILLEVSAFSDGIERYRSTTPYNAALCRDAYTRIYRLQERFDKEKRNGTLEPGEKQAFQELFDDSFMRGMLNIRIVGDHAEKTRGKEHVGLLVNGGPINLCAETSAGSFFPGPIGTVRDVEGRTYYIDHMEYLEKAEKRIQLAMALATKSQPTLE